MNIFNKNTFLEFLHIVFYYDNISFDCYGFRCYLMHQIDYGLGFFG